MVHRRDQGCRSVQARGRGEARGPRLLASTSFGGDRLRTAAPMPECSSSGVTGKFDLNLIDAKAQLTPSALGSCASRTRVGSRVVSAAIRCDVARRTERNREHEALVRHSLCARNVGDAARSARREAAFASGGGTIVTPPASGQVFDVRAAAAPRCPGREDRCARPHSAEASTAVAALRSVARAGCLLG
jgi:hypothetical protein